MSASLPSTHRLALGAIDAAAAWVVHAQPADGPALAGDSIGLAMVAASAYAGSDECRTRVLPSFDFRWSNGMFLSAAERLRYQDAAGRVLFGAQVTADVDRRKRYAGGAQPARHATHSARSLVLLGLQPVGCLQG